jgi:cation diffusion facilitator family transporter
VGLAALHWASKPADRDHAYGHAKVEYFSAGIEGALILVAAVTIIVTATDRLLHPQPLSDVGVGLVISAAASVINLGVGQLLVRAGRQARSIILEADGKHLLTDVWTSVGVIVGVAAVALTGWERLDGIVALAVAANIVITATGLLRRSGGGLMDRALEDDVRHRIEKVLASFAAGGVQFHALRTRQAGHRAFVSMHVLVPGAWTVQHGHDVAEEIEAALRAELPYTTVFTHLEPVEDARSYDDTALDRDESAVP